MKRKDQLYEPELSSICSTVFIVIIIFIIHRTRMISVSAVPMPTFQVNSRPLFKLIAMTIQPCVSLCILIRLRTVCYDENVLDTLARYISGLFSINYSLHRGFVLWKISLWISCWYIVGYWVQREGKHPYACCHLFISIKSLKLCFFFFYISQIILYSQFFLQTFHFQDFAPVEFELYGIVLSFQRIVIALEIWSK